MTAIEPGQDLRDYASAELDRARQCLTWRGPRLHEGVHQARKSLRRVRATLALAAAPLGRSGEWIDREVRRINRSLTGLRDAQALVEAVGRFLESELMVEQELLLRRALRAATRRRAMVGRQLAGGSAGSEEQRASLLVMLATLRALPWTAVQKADIQHAYEQSLASEQSAARKTLKRGREGDWHRWRRRARRVSQQDRALGARAQTPAGEQDKSLAVLLGKQQDCCLLMAHCGSQSPFAPKDRKALRDIATHELHHRRARAAKLAGSRHELQPASKELYSWP